MFARVIHFTVPERPNSGQLMAIERARALHPSWEVKVWSDPVDLSGHRLAKYHLKANSGAQLADLIRLDVVNLFGGIYLDSDIELCRPLDALCVLDNFFCSEDGVNLTNAAFGMARPGHPLLTALIDELLASEPDWTRPPNETTGPQLFARVMRGRLDMTLLPRDTFYPYNWNEEPTSAMPTTYGMHLWAASWKTGKWSGDTASVRVRKWFDWRDRAKGAVRRAVNFAARNWVDARLAAVPSQYSFGQDLVVNTQRGIRMSLPGSDLHETPELALTGTANEAALKFIERFVTGGDFVVDIGCGVGAAMLVAARKVGPFGRVFAVEPSTDLQLHLHRALEMNCWTDRVETLCHVERHTDGAAAGVALSGLDALFAVNAEIKVARWSASRGVCKDVDIIDMLVRKACAAYILVETPSDPGLRPAVLGKVRELLALNPEFKLRALDENGELNDNERWGLGDCRNIVLCRVGEPCV